MVDAIRAMKRAMIALSSGSADIPARIHLDTTAAAGTVLVMPGYLNDDQSASLAVKVVSVFNQNQLQGLPNITGVVNVLDPRTGQPIAVLDGATVTAIRTAATSAAATDALANPDSNTLAIIGSGTQAKAHFWAICHVREIKRATFFSPRREKVVSLISELRTKLDSEMELVIADDSGQATGEADIICTTTNSTTPVIDDKAVRQGTHINAVGAYKPSVVEIPGATVKRCRVFVDQLKTALAEAGDLVQSIQSGDIKRGHIAGEIGQVFNGDLPGRRSQDEVTLFKSVGNTVQDLVAAQLIVQRALDAGLGQQVDF